MEHSLENLYVDHLGLSLIYTKIENAGFSQSTNHTNDPSFEKEALGQLERAGAPIEAGTGRTDVESQAYSMCFIVLRSKAVHVRFVTNNIGP